MSEGLAQSLRYDVESWNKIWALELAKALHDLGGGVCIAHLPSYTASYSLLPGTFFLTLVFAG